MPFPAGPVAAFAVTATLGLVLRIVAKMEQRVVVRIRNQHYVAAAPAVAAAGTAARNEFLPPKSQAAVSSVAGLHGNDYFVYKHGVELGGAVWTAKRGGSSRPPIDAVGVPLALSDNVNVLPEPAAIAKFDRSGDLREQGVIFAETDVLARLVAGAALAHDNGAPRHEFARENLDAQPLRVRVAAILGAA